jgi:diguanylate cyclase (GGDEF)-like protein
VLLLFPLALTAQPAMSVYDYDIKQWTAADGLPSNAVRAVTQDPQGYLWVGTLEGLARFDGSTFETFTSGATRRQLIGNVITRLYTDSSGYIWIGTMTGLSGLNSRDLKFDRFNILGEVSAIAEVGEREIWVAADTLFRVKDGKVSRVEQIKEPVGQLEVTEEHVWVSTAKALYKLARNGQLERLELPTELAQLPIYDLQQWQGKLYLASEQGLYWVNENGQIILSDLPQEHGQAVYQLHRDHNDGFWVSASDRLYYQQADLQWQVISRDELGSTTQLNDLYEDKQQNVWMGSYGDGLYRASRGKIHRVIGQGQHDAVVRSVALTPHNQLLLASHQQLGVLDSEFRYTPIELKGQLPLTVVQDYHYDGKDWLLATDSGPKRLELPSGQLTMLADPLKGVKTSTIEGRSAGGVWIGSQHGLYLYDKKLTEFAHNSELESELITFVSDTGDKMLLGTSRGAYQFQQDRLLRIGLGTLLYNAYITAILQTPEGVLVVATKDDGLFIRQTDGKWFQYDTTNGLPFEPVLSLNYDATRGYIWGSSSKGIFRFLAANPGSPSDGRSIFEEVLSPYERQIGTPPGRCCNGMGAGKNVLWQDKIWFPTLKGLVSVPLNLKAGSKEAYQPLLQQVSATSLYHLVPEQSRLVLETDERNLSIKYTAIDFMQSAALEFRYQLSNFDEQWREVGSRREAIYTNLPAGRYLFRLQVRNQNQSWDGATETTLELVIPRRFEETLLYRGLWLMLGLLIIYSLIRLGQRNVRLREEELTKLVKLRTQELEASNSRLNELNEQLSQLTHKDALTGLRNRRFLFEQLPKDIEHYQRNRDSMLAQNKCVALLQLDLDNFKTINDKFGNSAGDSVLQQVSGLLIRETRGSDYVVRYGGEEFMLVLRDVAQDLVGDFALRLNELVAAESFVLPDGRVISAQCSVGYALYPLELLGGQLISWEVSLQLAELALYHVKHSGRNGVATIVFDRQVDAFEFEDSEHIEAEIENLLADGLARFESPRRQAQS